MVFVLSYALIAGTRLPGVRLDRPAGALVGAVAMVALGVLTPAEAVHGVNADTLLLLFGMMVVGAFLVEARTLRWVSWLTLTRVASPRRLLVAVTLVSGLLSAVLVNDTICVILTPLVLQLALDAGLPPKPFLLALAFGANAGSLATPTGNPQDMLIVTLSHLSYRSYTGALLLPSMVALALVALVLVVAFRRELPDRALARPRLERPELHPALASLCVLTLAGMVAAFFAGAPLSWTALSGAALLLLLGRRDPREVFEQVDFVLLVFFAALFVIVAGVGHAGLAQRMYESLKPLFGHTARAQAPLFGVFTVVASQVVSNVPFVLLAAHWLPRFADPRFLWLSTALFSTLAGNLTLVGSVANLIVVERAKERVRFGFFEFLEVGALVTVVSVAGAYGVLWGEHLIGLA